MSEVIIDLQIAFDADHNPSFEQVHRWASEALQHHEPEHGDMEVCMRIVDIQESQTLNKTYRKKDAPTNVLSFDYSDDDWEHEDVQLLGDLVLCADIIEEEALAQNKPAEAHWAHMIVHGILHLLKHDHQNKQDTETMETLEVVILKKLGYNNPYEVS